MFSIFLFLQSTWFLSHYFSHSYQLPQILYFQNKKKVQYNRIHKFYEITSSSLLFYSLKIIFNPKSFCKHSFKFLCVIHTNTQIFIVCLNNFVELRFYTRTDQSNQIINLTQATPLFNFPWIIQLIIHMTFGQLKSYKEQKILINIQIKIRGNQIEQTFTFNFPN